MAQLNFDANTVNPQETFEPIPAGWYNAMIDETEMKPTKNGTGAYLKVRFSIVGGQFNNRKVYTNLNIRNSNPTAQEIAYRQLSSICHAIGVMQVSDSQELHGKPLAIRVKIQQQEGYDPSNVVSGYKAAEDMQAASANPPWATTQQANTQNWQPAPQPWDNNAASAAAATASAAAQATPQPAAQSTAQPAQTTEQSSGTGVPPWMKEVQSSTTGGQAPWNK